MLRIDYFPSICGMPWLFVCSEFFHLIWGVCYSFHLQRAVNFFIQCVALHCIVLYRSEFDFPLAVLV